jgi:hypothetical protein
MKLKDFLEAPVKEKPGIPITTREQVDAFVKKLLIIEYTINDDLSVDVDHDVSIFNLKPAGYTNLPIKFRKINGDFLLRDPKVTTLQGCPDEVVGNFKIENIGITSLEGGPHTVNGYYMLFDTTALVSTKGMASHIGGLVQMLSCRKLTSLEGFPKAIGGRIELIGASALTSLKGLPVHIDGDLDIAECRSLTTLVGGPTSVESLDLSGCIKLKNLEGLPTTMSGKLILGSNRILLRDAYTIFMTKGISYITLDSELNPRLIAAKAVINKYLKQPYGNKRWIECQSELIDAGLTEYTNVRD